MASQKKKEKEKTYALCLIQIEKELEGLKTLRSIAELPFPKETSISIITPPKVNLFPCTLYMTCM